MKTISVFGVTGSVGAQAADIIAKNPDGFKVKTVTAGHRAKELAEAAIKLSASHCVIKDLAYEAELAHHLKGSGITHSAGPDAVVAAAKEDVDISVQAIVGFDGVQPSLMAAQNARLLALANKETVVCAGRFLRQACQQAGTKLIPLDSEHSAIFQCMDEGRAEIEKIILTASGGPFRDFTADELDAVTVEQACAHPTWDMGQRISIDSASMFNKAMEMVEAKELFSLNPNQIEVVIHPQSALHSAVELKDGAIIAHMGPTDMRAPIGFALYYPERRDVLGERLNLAQMGRLDFEAPDPDRFPALKLAQDVMTLAGDSGLVLNAAKEVGLDWFINGKIKFTDMAKAVQHSLKIYAEKGANPVASLDELIAMNQLYRGITAEFLEKGL